MKKIIESKNIDIQDLEGRLAIIQTAKQKRTMLSGIYGIESEKISQIIEKHKNDLVAIDRIIADYEKSNKNNTINSEQVKLDLYNLLMKEEEIKLF